MRKTPKRVIALLAALALAAPTATAFGDPPAHAGGPKGDAIKKAAEERKEAWDKKMGEVKDKIAEAKEQHKDKHADGGADEHADRDGGGMDKLRAEWARLRETRRDRRRVHREEIKEKFGPLANVPAVRAELKVHAWRLARLKRIRAVADAEGKTAVVARVDKLIEKENQRYQKHMDVLKTEGGTP